LHTSATDRILSPILCAVIIIALHFAAFPVVNEQDRDKLLAAVAIQFVETRGERAIQVEHTGHAAILDERHHEFGT
jgi:hypothetical protein